MFPSQHARINGAPLVDRSVRQMMIIDHDRATIYADGVA